MCLVEKHPNIGLRAPNTGDKSKNRWILVKFSTRITKWIQFNSILYLHHVGDLDTFIDKTLTIGNFKNHPCIGREVCTLFNQRRGSAMENWANTCECGSAECIEGALTPLTDQLYNSCYKSLTDRQFSRIITPFANCISSDNYQN